MEALPGTCRNRTSRVSRLAFGGTRGPVERYHLIDAGAASHALSVLESRFASAQSKLNPSRRKLLRMILENPEDTYYLSSRELAKRYQVDAATIVRTIQAL